MLQGISDTHFRAVKQIVVEVHDVNKGLQAVCDVLHRQGFSSVNVLSEDWHMHRIMRIYTVVGSRQ